MTRAAHELGRSSGLFRAPRVIECDARRGLLRMEELACLVRADERLRDAPDDLDLMRSVGRAIAAVHDQLRPGPCGAAGSPAGPLDPAGAVPIHGDFSLLNVCVQAGSGQVVLLDWSSASALPRKIAVGPRTLDLAQFLRSLVVHLSPLREALRRFPARAAAFLEGYESQARVRIDRAELARCARWVSAAHLRGTLRGAPGVRAVLRAARCWIATLLLHGRIRRLQWRPAEALEKVLAASGA